MLRGDADESLGEGWVLCCCGVCDGGVVLFGFGEFGWGWLDWDVSSSGDCRAGREGEQRKRDVLDAIFIARSTLCQFDSTAATASNPIR